MTETFEEARRVIDALTAERDALAAICLRFEAALTDILEWVETSPQRSKFVERTARAALAGETEGKMSERTAN